MGRTVLVTGDRYWTDRDYIFDVMDLLHAVDSIEVVVEGDARGVDWIVGNHPPGFDHRGKPDPEFPGGWAFQRDVAGDCYPAQWEEFRKLGKVKAAGPARNTQMLRTSPDLVVAFHPDLSKSKGTANMVAQARKAGITTVVFDGRSLEPEAIT